MKLEKQLRVPKSFRRIRASTVTPINATQVQQCKIGENVTDKTLDNFSLVSYKIHLKVSTFYSRMNKNYIRLVFIT